MILQGALSQTFSIPQQFKSGVFITSVDLFFAELGDDTAPVTVRIVETDNGYPSSVVVPGSSTTLPAVDLILTSTGTAPTKFKFNDLIWLSPNKDYAIAVISNSIKYKLWVAQLGEDRIDKALTITEQPSAGSLFRSQNSSTWTADQLQDIKFTINYAKFDVSKSASILLSNPGVAQTVTLPPNPFFIKNGQTAVKVTHPNHGLIKGRFVSYSGSTASQFNNTTFTVKDVIDSDSYTITSTSPSVTDHVGGAVVVTEKNIRIDEFNVQATTRTPDNTSISYFTKMTDTAKETSYTEVVPGVFNSVSTPKYVYSNKNERSILGNARSLDVLINMYSTDTAVSPIINMNTVSVACNTNKIDSRTADPSVGAGDFAPMVLESAATGNSLESRHITLPVILKSVATGLRCIFLANVTYPATFELWYRTTTDGSVNPLNAVTWTQKVLPPIESHGSTNSYTEYEIDIAPAQSFVEFQVKFVFKSTDSSKVPKIKELRIIALS